MTPSQTARPLVITWGDPRGIGPELLIRLAAEGELLGDDVVVADPARLAELSAALDAPWAGPGWQQLAPLVVDSPTNVSGQVDALERGVDLVLERPGRALVTAPIHKAAARAEGFTHPGHTEYLAERCGIDQVAMLMAGASIRVALATIHVPLREVADTLTAERIVGVGELLASGLREHFGVAKPRIGVLGLNPHAGESGLLGDEEQRIIAPAISTLRGRVADSAEVEGPLSADSAFFFHLQRRLDGLVAMYHDQGLAPFKLLHFTDGVNMTLGLPFVRTSPDHGTARDLAGRGTADPSSMIAAVRLARGTAR